MHSDNDSYIMPPSGVEESNVNKFFNLMLQSGVPGPKGKKKAGFKSLNDSSNNSSSEGKDSASLEISQLKRVTSCCGTVERAGGSSQTQGRSPPEAAKQIL